MIYDFRFTFSKLVALLLVICHLALVTGHAYPVVVFNPTNGVVLIPTNFVAANLAGVTVSNYFNGTATNLSGNALVQATNIARSVLPTTATNLSGAALTQTTNISLAIAQAVAATNQPTTITNLSGGALLQVTNIATSLLPTTATNISGGALTQVTNIASSLSGPTNLNWNGITNAPNVVTNGPGASWSSYGMNGLGIVLDDARGVVVTNSSSGAQMVISTSQIQLWSDGISIDLLNREIHGGGGTWEFYEGGANGDFSGTFTGTGAGLTFTNAAGSRFRIIVNTATNGFTFVPVP